MSQAYFLFVLQAPSFLVSHMVSASVATLPWMALMHASTWPIDLKDPAAEVRTHSPERELDAGGTWDHNLSAALNLNDKRLSSPEPHQ